MSLRPRRGKTFRHAIESGGRTAAGEKAAVVIGAGPDEFKYPVVCPFEGVRGAPGCIMQVGVGTGVMFEKFVTDIVGRAHHQRGGGRIQVNAWSALAVDGRVLGIAPDEARLQARH